jgi:protein-S-isoprenylcysteine O-methyltransferase Ste14
MSLHREIARQGEFLFRHRSVLPLLTLPLFAGGFRSYEYVQGSHAKTEMWQLACLAISLVGVGVRAWTAGFLPTGTSGRNTCEQVADRLNVTGPYSVSRHPLYLGNGFIWLGVALLFRTWWMPLVVTTSFALYYERIMYAEESFLRDKFGAAFDEWAARTPGFFPDLRRWRRSDLAFSWRTALRREYTAAVAVAAVFLAFDVVGETVVVGRPQVDRRWLITVVAVVAFYVVVRAVERRTRLLHVPGR